MANQATMSGNWNEMKGKIRSKWGQMTDDAIEQCKGNMEALVGTIQRTTGEAREKIQEYLKVGMEQGADVYNRTSETVRAATETAYEGAVEGAKYVGDSIRAGADQTGKMIQARPLESLMFTFGAGIVAGLAIGLVLRAR